MTKTEIYNEAIAAAVLVPAIGLFIFLFGIYIGEEIGKKNTEAEHQSQLEQKFECVMRAKE